MKDKSIQPLQEDSSLNRARLILLAAVLTNLICGANYAWSIISKELALQYGWNAKEMSMPYTVALLLNTVALFLGGRMTDRFSPRYTALSGGLFLGVGLILSAFISNPLWIAVAYGIGIGFGSGMCGAVTISTPVKLFPVSRKGMVSGITMCGSAFSSAVLSPYINWLMSAYDPHITFIVLGLTGMFVICSCAMVFPRNPAAAVAAQAAADDLMMKPKDIIRTSRFYILWGVLFLGSCADLSIIGNTAIIVLRQASLENGAFFTVWLAVCNGVARLLIGSLSDRIGVKKTLMLVTIVQGINLLCFRFYTTFPLLLLGMGLTGAGFGGMVSMMPTATSDFSRVYMGENYAWVCSAYGVGGFVGPLICAALVDLTGSFNVSYLVCFGMLAASLLMLFGLKPAVRRTQKDAVKQSRA